MSESCKSTTDIAFEDSIPEAGASLESILCTEELQRRPSRPPDHEKENRALVALVSALADTNRRSQIPSDRARKGGSRSP
jgi:hypothetical protein